MKSTYISIVIFLCLVCFIFYADNSFKELCNNVIDECNQVLNELNDENWDNAENISINISKEIKNSELLSSVYINHTDFDILTNESLKLSSYIHRKDDSESLTSVIQLKEYAINLRDLHKLSIENIF